MKFLLLLFTLLPTLVFSNVVRTGQVEAELVAERAALVPGEPVTVALRLKAIPGWHTYWRNPGDSGEPTRIEWRLPRGFSAGEIEWPVPERIPVGPLMNFGYHGEVLLLTRVGAAGGPASRQAGHAAREGELAGVRGALHPGGRRARGDAAGRAQLCAGCALGQADRRRALAHPGRRAGGLGVRRARRGGRRVALDLAAARLRPQGGVLPPVR